MGTSGRAEAVAEAQEVSLVDRVEHFGHRALDDLVLERGKAKGPLASISFRDVGAEHRPGPVLSAVDACVQALEISLQVLLILLHRYPIELQDSPRAAVGGTLVRARRHRRDATRP